MQKVPMLCEAALGKHTFDGRVIFVDEMALDQLDGQARFTDTTAADNDELVLSQELRTWVSHKAPFWVSKHVTLVEVAIASAIASVTGRWIDVGTEAQLFGKSSKGAN